MKDGLDGGIYTYRLFLFLLLLFFVTERMNSWMVLYVSLIHINIRELFSSPSNTQVIVTGSQKSYNGRMWMSLASRIILETQSLPLHRNLVYSARVIAYDASIWHFYFVHWYAATKAMAYICYGTATKYGQIAPSPSGSPFALICAISSSVSSNPNTSALFLMRSGLSLFGSGTNPRCSDQRTNTCVGETPCALAIATSVGSLFLVARTKGA